MENLYWLSPLFLALAALYASVGLGGGSSYTALLALFALPQAARIPPTALCLDVVVAGIAFWAFYRGGHFSGTTALPFLATSVPGAIAGGLLPLETPVLLSVLAVGMGAAGLGLWMMDHVLDHCRYPILDLRRDWIPDPGVWLKGTVGGLLGLLAGITGIGGGILLVPVLILTGWAPEKTAASVGALFVLANASAGLTGHLIRGNVPLPGTFALGGAVVVGGALGGWFGARVAAPVTVRRTMSVLLLLVTVRLVFHLL